MLIRKLKNFPWKHKRRARLQTFCQNAQNKTEQSFQHAKISGITPK